LISDDDNERPLMQPQDILVSAADATASYLANAAASSCVAADNAANSNVFTTNNSEHDSGSK